MTNPVDELDSEDETNNSQINKNKNRSGTVSLKKHTEVVDKLRIKNDDLLKALNDQDDVISQLEFKLSDSYIRISKTFFYICVALVCFFIYTSNQLLTEMKDKVSNNTTIINELRKDIEKHVKTNDDALIRIEELLRKNKEEEGQ